jgi:hypothetical protein
MRDLNVRSFGTVESFVGIRRFLCRYLLLPVLKLLLDVSVQPEREWTGTKTDEFPRLSWLISSRCRGWSKLLSQEQRDYRRLPLLLNELALTCHFCGITWTVVKITIHRTDSTKRGFEMVSSAQLNGIDSKTTMWKVARYFFNKSGSFSESMRLLELSKFMPVST